MGFTKSSESLINFRCCTRQTIACHVHTDSYWGSLSPMEFIMDRAQKEGGILMWESWTIPAHNTKLWWQNQCERRSYDKAGVYYSRWFLLFTEQMNKIFFGCAFAHSANTALTLTKPSTQFPKSKLPTVLNFQLLLHFFSLHFCSVSRCSSRTCRAQPSAPHGLIFYTHAPTLKNPLGHMIHHLFKPCHVPGFFV